MAISFKGAHFPQDIMLMGVRWYVAYPLNSQHVEDLLEERGGPIDHVVEALATLFQQHHIAVVQQCSANPRKVSTTVRLATVAQLRAAVSRLQAQPGEECRFCRKVAFSRVQE